MGSVVSYRKTSNTKQRKSISRSERCDDLTLLSCYSNSTLPDKQSSPCPLKGSSPHLQFSTWSILSSKSYPSPTSSTCSYIPAKKARLCMPTWIGTSKISDLQEEGFLCTYLRLFDDETIQDFMWTDCCALLIDKYLIAMVYIYFRRANLRKCDYNKFNFFLALHLAHDIEEDNEDLKQEIYPWALGRKWKSKCAGFFLARDRLLIKMDFRALVSRVTCEEERFGVYHYRLVHTFQIIELSSQHPIWKRCRQPHHGGTTRTYPSFNETPLKLRGPNRIPQFCDLCFCPEERRSSVDTSGCVSDCTMHSLPE